MKNLKALLIVASMYICSVARAEGGIEDIPPGEDVIVTLKKGEPAPFNGEMFDINTSIRWANWLTQYKKKLAADVAKEKALCASELQYERDISSVQEAMYSSENADLKTRLMRSEQGRLQAEHERDNPAWYSTPLFGVAVGVLGAVGLMYAGSQIF